MEILLSDGNVALIDDEDHEIVKGRVWNPVKSRNVVYARFGRVYLHRLIMNARRGQIVDHINGNGLDNRKQNLRFASYQLNRANAHHRKTIKTCKYIGVSKRKGRFYVQMKVGKKNGYFGPFSDELEAAKFYNEKAREIHGDLAYQNIL